MSRRAALALALVAGATVYLLSTQVFPYHTTNHDEAVYLQQAAMLLEGRLFLDPPVEGSFRPWFFVDDGGRFYPKYAPVPAATFAAGKLVGGYAVALAGIGAAVVGLTYGVVAEAFDRRTGILAGAFVLASPLFLIDTAVFLPYAPTAAWNLLFAFSYLRADRTGSRRWAAVAGAAVGVAFFARPYTAVLFAAPFVLHAAWSSRRLERDVLLRNGVVGAFGVGGVLLTLGYNATVTGSPLLFPYEAFAPLDGPGFGRREILGYSREYTPTLALRANAVVVRAFFAEWFAAGILGACLAVAGLGDFLRRARCSVDPRKLVLAGLFVSVVAGNVYFWGNLNVLGASEDPNGGLVRFLGPYYHYDLLLPTAAFAAHGSLVLADEWRSFVDGGSFERRGTVRRTGLVVGALVLCGAAAGTAAAPIQENRAVTAQLEAAYEPLEAHDLDGALVFLPTPYGAWLNHPFQALRNDPGYDGEVVYAIRSNQFEVVDAFPDRAAYRYVYRGTWAPFLGTPVEAELQPVRSVSGERVRLHSTLGIPDGVESVSVRLASDGEPAYYAANDTTTDQDLVLTVGDGTATLSGDVTPQGGRAVPFDGEDALIVEAFVEYGAGDGFTYRIELPVERSEGEVRALTPYLEVCTVPRLCGGEAAYIPGEARDGVSIETRFEASGGSS